jgi:hypothetical protein
VYGASDASRGFYNNKSQPISSVDQLSEEGLLIVNLEHELMNVVVGHRFESRVSLSSLVMPNYVTRSSSAKTRPKPQIRNPELGVTLGTDDD